MTSAALNYADPVTISGVGPYNIPHEYSAGGIIAFAVGESGQPVQLEVENFTLEPESSELTGSLYLSASAAGLHDGETLYIRRQTGIVQDWSAVNSASEASLAVQLDYLARGLQEVQERSGRSVVVFDGRVKEVVPEPGHVLMWGDPGDRLATGPRANQVADAQHNAEAAAQSLVDVSAFFGLRYDDIAALKAAPSLPVGTEVRVGPVLEAGQSLRIFPNGTYVANENTVFDLHGSGMQAVSQRFSMVDPAEVLADTRGAAEFAAGAVLSTFEGYKYTVVADDGDMVTAGGVELALNTRNSVGPEAFGAVGDGVTDDTVALEAWATFIEKHGLTGQLLNKTYGVLRTLRLTGKGGYVGHEGTNIVALPGFATDYIDPVSVSGGGVGTMTGKAPVVFYDGRGEAVDGEVTRVPKFQSIRVDGRGLAPTALLAAGILPMTTASIRCRGGTLAHAVLAGIQNAEIGGIKVQAGDNLASKYAVIFANTAKNLAVESLDVTGTAEGAEAYLFIGVDTDYPGPGGVIAASSEGPSILTFRSGVFESIGGAGNPKRYVHIEDAAIVVFDQVNMAGKPSVCGIQVDTDCRSCIVRGGRLAGFKGTDRATVPAIVNNSSYVHVDKTSLLQWDGSTFFENNGSGVFEYQPNDAETSGTAADAATPFSGTANAANSRVYGGRVYGNQAALEGLHYEQVAGRHWRHTEKGMSAWYDPNDGWVDSEGVPVPTGSSAISSWPQLNDADVTAGVLDIQGYRKVKLNLSSPTTITGISALALGQTVKIAPTNNNATFASGSGMKPKGRVPVNVPVGRIITFERTNSTGSAEWVQSAGPEGLKSATSAQLGNAANDVNTIDKYAGKMVLDTTTDQMMVATGGGASDNWAGGGTTVTPV